MKRLLERFLRLPPVAFVSDVVELYFSCRVSRAAAELAYFLVLTFFPILICVSAFVSKLNLEMTALLEEASYVLPQEVLSIFRDYLGYIDTHQSDAMLVAGVIMVGFYLMGCWVLYPHNELDQAALSLIGYTLSGALPLWFGAQAVSVFCVFHVRSSTAGSFLALGILGVLPSMLQAFGMLFHPVFETMRQYTPAFMLDNLKNMAFSGNYIGLCWASGLLWFAVFAVAGVVLFQKKEIR